MSVPERLAAALAEKYTLERELGQGGMATVYLAEDLKHDRKVAVKVLKPELAAVVGGDRFVTEIRTTANLQHPHILPLFDSGEADSFLFYVMPYVEGEALRDKLDREKQLSVPEAIAITVKIAGALQSAHDQGVIHRDIKPANVLLQNGEPVVADFGIALAVQQAGEGRITETGLSLGTPYYMAPEQATGDRDPDARSDLYSLACMLYEMLTGEPPFQGSTAQAVLGRILTEPPPDVTRARPSVPPHIGAILSRALQKLPADRFESVAEFSRALQNEGYIDPAARASGAWAAAQGGGGPTWARLLPWGVAAVMTLVAIGGLLLRPAPPTAIATLAELSGPGVPSAGGVHLAISPDGALIVAVGVSEGAQGSELFRRRAGSVEWQPIPNTEGARGPSISPDGAWVAFDRQGEGIFKVPIEGGSDLPVAASGRAPHWGLDGTIVFAGDDESLYRVPGSGGEPELLLDRSRLDEGAVFPHILPDGSAVLFSTPTGGDALNGRIFLYDIASDEVRPVVPSGNRPVYLPTGHVVYGHASQTLAAVTLDLATGEVGSPTTVIPELAVFNGGASQFAVAHETGTLVYVADAGSRGDGAAGGNSFVEVGFDGVERSLDLSPGSLSNPRYSPDGARIAYQEEFGIRVYDVATGASPLLAEDGVYPVWSPRGDHLYYTSDPQSSGGTAFRSGPDPGQSAEQLYSSATERYVRAVLEGSGGDSILILRENHPDQGRDLLLMRMGPAGAVPEDVEPSPFLTAEWDEWQAEISPDGRHVAYVSNQEGVERVYLQTFPTPGERQVVSPLGGTDPRWAPDGQSIFYRVGTTFFEVDLRFDPSVAVGDLRRVLDEPRYQTGGFLVDPNYDIHPDGDRFVLAVCVDGCEDGRGVEGDSDFYIVTNWFTELLQLTGEAAR
jgi:serine/threonine-protein kinase